MNAPIDVTGVELHTQRLTLRPWRQSDLEDFFEYASVEGVGQMAGWLPHRNTQETQKILDSFIGKKKTFALDYQGKAIGSLGIEEYDGSQFPALLGLRCRSLGFVLSKAYWGQGLMPEALNAVIQWLFEEIGLDAILCAHFDWNIQSAKVQAKCGFRPFAVGTYETAFGKIEKDITNILYREDWEADHEMHRNSTDC